MTLAGVRVRFTYDKDSGVTTASMDDGNDELLCSFARCHKSDIYRRSTGRKIALDRLLKASGLDREQRRAVWDDYWSRCKR